MNVSSPLQDAARTALKRIRANACIAHAAGAGGASEAIIADVEAVTRQVEALALLSEDRPAVTREQILALSEALKKSRFTTPAGAMHADHEALRRAVAEILPALLKEGREEPQFSKRLRRCREVTEVLYSFVSNARNNKDLDFIGANKAIAALSFEHAELGKATPSEVETVDPPLQLEYAGKTLNLIPEWTDETAQEEDLIVFPLGMKAWVVEHGTEMCAGFLRAAIFSGAALYRLRVEPQPPVPEPWESPARFDERGYLCYGGSPDSGRAGQRGRLVFLPEEMNAAQTLTQGGEKP